METTMTTASADRELLADGLLTVEEAIKFARLGRTELYARINNRELRSVKIGRRRLIPKRALIDLISRNLVEKGMGQKGLGRSG